METLQDRVRWLLSVAGVDASHASLALLKSPSHLHQIVRGKVTNPRSETLRKLAVGFGVSLDWLMNGRGTPPSQKTVSRRIKAAITKHNLDSAQVNTQMGPAV